MCGIVAPNDGFALIRAAGEAVFLGKLDFLLVLRYIQLSLI
jgi:hypothetical protein